MDEHREIHAPYPGLRPFEAHETPIFFGREAHVSRLLEILRRERFLAVIGTSGSGKSSLVRAGMLPALAMGWTSEASDWRIAVLRPGDRPIRRLADALLMPSALAHEIRGFESLGGEGPSTASFAPLVEAELSRGPLGLVSLVDDALRNKEETAKFNLLVLVDQFEEIFRYAEKGAEQENECEAFINAILQPRLETSAAAARVHVALTMRIDALHECARFLDLPEAINCAQYLTPRLRPEDLRRAITEPARVFGGRVEPEVATALVNGVINAPDQLPILQHALARMWESARRRDASHPLLTDEDVAKAGGIADALSRHANSVFAELSPVDQLYSDALFRAITAVPLGGTTDARRPQRLADIARMAGLKPDDWHVFLPVLRAFAIEGVNFLSFAEPVDARTVIDISHEALIRQWDRLHRLVTLEAEGAAAYRRWRNRSDDWKRGGELLSGTDLAAAVGWRDGVLARDCGPEQRLAASPALPSTRPTAAWAARYARSSGQAEAADEFKHVLRFIEQSEQKEQERVRTIQLAEDDRKAAESREILLKLEAQRERAEAAAREYALSEAGARKSRNFARAALGIAVVAVLSAGLAVLFWRQASESATQASESAARASESAAQARTSFIDATTTRLAVEGQARIAGVRPGGPVRGVLEVLAAYQVQPSVEAYFGLQSAASQLDRVVRLIEAPAPITAAVLSPDGKRILTGSENGALTMWDTGTGLLLGEPIPGHSERITGLAFDPNGRYFVSVGSDRTLRLWDADTRVPLGKPLDSGTDLVYDIAVSPDGKWIVSGGDDYALRMWDASNVAAVGAPMRGHTGPVTSVTFSPDGTRIASGSMDKTVRLWDASTRAALDPPLRGHTEPVRSVVFSPDGKRILSGSFDRTVRLWDPDSGIAIGQLTTGQMGRVTSLAISPNGKWIVSAGNDDNMIRLWDAEKGTLAGEPFRGHSARVTSVAFTPDGNRIVSSSVDKSLRIWSATRSIAVDRSASVFEGLVLEVAFAPDGKRVVSANADSTLRVWDVDKGVPLGKPMRGHSAGVTSVAFSPDGKRIVSGSFDETLQVWDSETGVPLGKQMHGHEGAVWCVAISPDGRQIASGGDDKTIRLWDADSGIALGAPLSGHEGRVTSVAFSPDGKQIVSGSGDKTLRLWDTASGAALGNPLSGHTDWVRSVAFSPDGKRIVSGSDDRSLRLWDAVKGVALGEPLIGHTARVTSVAFAPDGKHLVSGSFDKAVRLWDADKGIALGEPIVDATSRFVTVAFGPDGRHVASGGGDKIVTILPVLDAWADSLCKKLPPPRRMTDAEWTKWVGNIPYAASRQCAG